MVPGTTSRHDPSSTICAAPQATPYLPALLDKGTSALQAVDQKASQPSVCAWNPADLHCPCIGFCRCGLRKPLQGAHQLR